MTQTAILLQSLGYSEAVVGGAHVISQFVDAPYWALQLSSEFSVRTDDLTDIIAAMVKDAHQNSV